MAMELAAACEIRETVSALNPCAEAVSFLQLRKASDIGQ
jgi:hypothetical protein